MNHEFLVWQLIDSGFPAGGFAHSGGLEAARAARTVVDGAGVLRVRAAVAGARGPQRTAVRHGRARTTREHCRARSSCRDVFLTNPIANRASRAQGRALLTSVARSFPRRGLAPSRRAIRGERAVLATTRRCSACVFNALDVDLAETQRAFLFMTVRGVAPRPCAWA